jgi:DNA-binding NtrC family response regulator
VVLGRAAGCDLPIEAKGVSREHVAIEVLADGGATLQDLGSTNGTRVDGQRIGARALSGDFVLELGEARLRFREHDAELGALAYRVPDAQDTSGRAETAAVIEAAEVTRTRLDTQLQRLREALRAQLDLRAAVARGSAVLAAARATLDARALSLRDAAGHVLAAAGQPGQEERVWIQDERLQLWLDSDCWPADSTTDAVRQWLRWWGVGTPAPAPAAPAAPSFPGVVASGSPLQAALRGLARVARSRVGVLILGESGTGKELVARWVHDSSPRASGPFVAINCAALPRDLLEAELFGIEKGAATGVEARPGVFERAHGGTLFLDELGDMPLETQVRLLRAVEDGRIHRIGGKRLLEVDVRLLAATHSDLQQAINEGRFRLDLFHRIAGFELTLPPLRERAGDVAPLAFHFFARALAESGTRSPGMTEAALRCLRGWHWPGNVRELRQAVEGATALLADGEALDATHLPARLRQAGELAAAEPRAPVCAATGTLADAVAQAERAALLGALAAAGDDPEVAWTQLGIGKTTFYKKLKELGIQREPGPGKAE